MAIFAVRKIPARFIISVGDRRFSIFDPLILGPSTATSFGGSTAGSFDSTSLPIRFAVSSSIVPALSFDSNTLVCCAAAFTASDPPVAILFSALADKYGAKIAAPEIAAIP